MLLHHRYKSQRTDDGHVESMVIFRDKIFGPSARLLNSKAIFNKENSETTSFGLLQWIAATSREQQNLDGDRRFFKFTLHCSGYDCSQRCVAKRSISRLSLVINRFSAKSLTKFIHPCCHPISVAASAYSRGSFQHLQSNKKSPSVDLSSRTITPRAGTHILSFRRRDLASVTK